MSDLRKYIDLVESLDEAFMSPIQPRAFGRKGTAPPKPAMPFDPEKRAAIQRAAEYGSAQEYADANNPYYPIYNTDPPHIKAQFEEENDRLLAHWNHWKQLGYF